MNKYHAKRTKGHDGYWYHSKREAEHGWGLHLREKAGEIRGLERQVRYEVMPAAGDFKPVYYFLDFRYYDLWDKRWHYVDVKGCVTPVYRMKEHMMLLVHGIKVERV